MFVEYRRTAATAAVSLCAVLALWTSCQSPEQNASATAVDASTGTRTPEGRAPDVPAPDRDAVPVSTPGSLQSQDPQGQESLANQRARFLVKHYLQVAKRLQLDNKLEEARALLTRAKDLMPANEEVLNALAAVNAELTPGHPGIGKTYAEQMEHSC